MELKIVYKNIDDLIPYINNSRTHSDDQINQIASSIKEFGFTNPVLLDGDNGIIAGHGRLQAAKKLKINKIPTLELAHLSEAQKKAYIIADNKLALNAGWDNELLRIEIEELQSLDFDTDILGFNADELKDILQNADIIEMPELSDADPELQQMTFMLHNEQVDIIKEAISLAKKNLDIESELNTNSNGNAIAIICELFITQNANS